tara:strand:+ start:3421 stop:5196 length:1776 start_codon:yes stop_codon:yes gene_type:complete
MAIKRYTANADNTITNAFEANLQTRGTGSNMGESDILETFTIYGQAPAVGASARLYINESSPVIAVDGSEKIILVGESTYEFVATGSVVGLSSFDASGNRSDVLTNITSIINTSASVHFSASITGFSVKIDSLASGDQGNQNSLSSSLNNTSPETLKKFTGGTGGLEQSRILINFPVTEISADRAAGDIPPSGSVSFYLRVHNAPHGQTLPKDYNLTILAASRSWTEGYGLDMESYSDSGTSNWISSSIGQAWDTQGGDYHTTPAYSQYIATGTEDVEVDISHLVEEWMAGSKTSDGLGIQISSSYVSLPRSFYTKKFFARGSEFVYLRPKIEARWNSSMKDRRNSFYASSSLVPATDNLNTLYIYNKVRGQLQDIPAIGTGEMSMSLYYGESTAPAGAVLTITGSTGIAGTSVTGGWVSKGIYSASVAINTTSSYLYDVWHNGAGTQYVTGSQISVRSFLTNTAVDTGEYVSNITNLKEKYITNETARLRLFVRDKDWNPTIYTVATANIETKVIEDAYYKVFRVADDFNVIAYGTGSLNCTRMSYDKNGNYFDIDLSLFEKGYSYGIKVAYKRNNNFNEQPELFKFRVE